MNTMRNRQHPLEYLLNNRQDAKSAKVPAARPLTASGPQYYLGGKTDGPAVRPYRSEALTRRHSRGFTLIELLVVISIIAVLAALTIPVLQSVKRQQYLKTAGAEMARLETALENYKAKYGAYPPGNANPGGTYAAPQAPALFPQLYYELSGVTVNGPSFVTLDGSASIPISSVSSAYGVGGFINCTKGSGEDGITAENFISGLSSHEIYSGSNNYVPGTFMIVTSVGGPDAAYQPFGVSGVNPFRYVYPGVNNPGGYDLWVQLVINGQTNLVCNWSRQVQLNNPLP